MQRIKLSKLQNEIASGNKSKFGLRKCSLKAQSRNIYRHRTTRTGSTKIRFIALLKHTFMSEL